MKKNLGNLFKTVRKELERFIFQGFFYKKKQKKKKKKGG